MATSKAPPITTSLDPATSAALRRAVRLASGPWSRSPEPALGLRVAFPPLLSCSSWGRRKACRLCMRVRQLPGGIIEDENTEKHLCMLAVRQADDYVGYMNASSRRMDYLRQSRVRGVPPLPWPRHLIVIPSMATEALGNLPFVLDQTQIGR